MIANAGFGGKGGSILGDKSVGMGTGLGSQCPRSIFVLPNCCEANGQTRRRRAHHCIGAYSSSKFAVRGLTQCAALELGEQGITVNAYAPGVIQTELIGPILSGPGSVRDLLKMPHAKLGQPEDIASIVSYLVKPEAHFITGQSINVDGGLHFD